MNAFKTKPIILTKQDGFFWDFKEYYRIESNSCSTSLPLAGALATLSSIASHRIIGRLPGSIRRVPPNLYILAAAKSGTGKQSIRTLIETLLKPYQLLGLGNYGSSKAIVHGLPLQQARTDILDEAQTLFQKIKRARESWETEIISVLCDLFTSSNSEFRGLSSMHLGTNFGRVIQPHLNIYATGVLDIEKYFSESLFSTGLLARFIYFKENERVKDYSQEDNVFHAAIHMSSMRSLLGAVHDVYPKKIIVPRETHLKITTTSNKRKQKQEEMDPGPGNTYGMFEVDYTKDVCDAYYEFMRECDKTDLGSLDPVVQRLGEITLRVCLSRFLGISGTCPVKNIDLDNWEWSKNLVLNGFKTLQDASDNSDDDKGRENNFSDRAMKIYNYLKKYPSGKGGREIDRSLGSSKRVFENATDREALVKYLIDSGHIIEGVEDGKRIYIAK